jgi:Tetraspanin family
LDNQLVGLGLIIVGCLIETQYSDYLAFFDGKVNAAAVVIITVGSILFIVGFFGCCGAYKENRCMLAAVSNYYWYNC